MSATETQPRSDAPERAVLAAVLRPGADPGELAEMRELLHTAGVQVVGEVWQHRSTPDARTYVGSGKVEELRVLCRELNAEVLVCEDDLTPNQQRRLEDTLEMRVVDRTRVILDIFALHARSAEGKLQVELAQLNYNLQRMRGMWKHLERLGGGVGTRGPGESQLETDRRLARDRVALLRRRLERVRAHRQTLRKRRDRASLPRIALAGYTNVGKSSLLNALTGSTVSAANRLFHTLDPTTRAFDYLGRTYVVTDTVGFIRKLPHGLVEAFASTLEETVAGDLILHVCDASAEESELAAQIAAVDSVLSEIGADDLPHVLVLNKIDLCDEVTRRRLRNRHGGAIQVSAETGEGIEALTVEIARRFAGRFERVELLVPFDRGEILGELYDLGSPIEREEEADGVRVRAHLPRGIAARYAEFRVPEHARDATAGA